MLVLSRKKQETIHIGDDITITVIRIKGKSIRLGIDAPSGYTVLRGELKQKDQEALVAAKNWTVEQPSGCKNSSVQVDVCHGSSSQGMRKSAGRSQPLGTMLPRTRSCTNNKAVAIESTVAVFSLESGAIR